MPRRYQQTDQQVDAEFEDVDVRVSNLEATSGTPIGTVIVSMRTDLPNGWLICNGGEHAIAAYPQLFRTIQRAGGAPTVDTNFKLPNLGTVGGFPYIVRAK